MTGFQLLFPVVLLASITVATNAKTVVFFPPPSTSYFVYHTNVAGALAGLGHDVYICVPHFLLPKNLIKNKAVKIMVYGEHLGHVMDKIFESTRMVDKFWKNETAVKIIDFYYMTQEFNKISDAILSEKSFVDKLRNLKPDLFVIDSIPFNINMVVLPYMLDVPYALIGTLHDIVLSKVPFSPAAPIYPGDTMNDRMSFTQRMGNFLFYIIRINFDFLYDSSLVSKFAPHKPYKCINDLAADAEIFITETDHILDYPRPTLPNTKLVGGSSASSPKPLTGEFKSFVDGAENGVIVVSFGGSVVDVPPYITSKMGSAFKRLNLRVVWRVNITSPDPEQILTTKWLPQNDLLGHNKTKLFISHCGKNGQYEALYHAVPILCLPIFGDQNYNAERVQVKQLGLLADMREASVDELAELMSQLIYNNKYSDNMKKASRLYRELYKVPMQEAAYWLDHVIKYGGEYMRSSGQQMPWYQLYVLDVIAFLAGVFIIIHVLVYILIKHCYLFYKRNAGSSKRKHE